LSIDLQQRWRIDVASLLAPQAEKDAAFAEILARHTEPHRRYHGLPHLAALFALLDAHAPSAPLSSRLAVWYHDAIYDPRAADNEAQSATLAREHLRGLGADQACIDETVALIEATRDHWSGPSLGAGDYFLDADIAILGAPPHLYDRYAADVRAEYAWAPDELYRAGRVRFLDGARARARIFRTDAFEHAFAAAARDNMRRERATLAVT